MAASRQGNKGTTTGVIFTGEHLPACFDLDYPLR